MNKQKLYIVKIGGNIIDEEAMLNSFLHQFAQIEGNKILVHGGGKLATQLANQLAIPQTMIDGRRVTDFPTLKVVTMVYAGWINKSIVAKLNALQCSSIGVCGADAQLIQAHQRMHPSINYGYVGDVDDVSVEVIQHFFNLSLSPVIAPIAADVNGQLLNINADTIAQVIATKLAQQYQVHLIYGFEKAGVLLDVYDASSLIPRLTHQEYIQLKSAEKIFSGMIPKLDNAFAALQLGVEKVVIGNASDLKDLLDCTTGTTITYE